MAKYLLSKPKAILLHLFVLLLVATGYSQSAGSGDSIMLLKYNMQHEKHALSDTAFLNAIEPLLLHSPVLTNTSLVVPYLNKYKTLAWKANSGTPYKTHYYFMLATRELILDRLGSSLYYSEKMYGEALRLQDTVYRLRYYNSAMSMFIEAKSDLPSALSFYKGTVQPFTNELVVNFTKLPALQQRVLNSIFTYAGWAYIESGDSIAAKFIIEKMRTMTDAFRQNTPFYRNHLPIVNSRYAYLNFKLAQLERNQQSADFWMQQQLNCFPDSLAQTVAAIGYNAIDTYMYAYEFYADSLGKYDKAAVYVDKLDDLLKNPNLSLFSTRSSEKAKAYRIFADLHAHQNNYKQAYQLLKETSSFQDSALKKVSRDRDNNLYALTTADETYVELEQAQAEKIRQQRLFLWILSGAALVAIGLVGTIIYLRGRHQNRLLQSKLDIARNLHDEIGPVMFYAKTLVKSISSLNDTENGAVSLVEKEMQKAMELLRTISHDIKDTINSNTEKLAAELHSMLQKIGTALELKTNFIAHGNSKKLGFNVYHHLRAIVGELITNSLKHSECDSIGIQLKTSNDGLTLLYMDNGIGMPLNNDYQKGIGLANITERAARISASLDFEKPPNGPGLLATLKVKLT